MNKMCERIFLSFLACINKSMLDLKFYVYKISNCYCKEKAGLSNSIVHSVNETSLSSRVVQLWWRNTLFIYHFAIKGETESSFLKTIKSVKTVDM